jgi:hypothetical protein
MLGAALLLPAQDAGGFVVMNDHGGAAAAGQMTMQFQQLRTMAVPRQFDRVVLSDAAMARQTVTGRPVSGTEEQKSTQTLGDGTVITTSTTDKFFRDSAGRTRLENNAENRITIFDPVAHTSVTLNTETKKATRMTLSADADRVSAYSVRQVTNMSFSISSDGAGDHGNFIWAGGGKAVVEDAETRKNDELGVESLNGVLAAHTRNTLTIPQGQIGNDRDIHVVNERWYSDDLQMLVKTVNSDPRFGVQTYEFTGISRDEPDAALFQIPADYTLVDFAHGIVKSLPVK